MRCFGHTGDGAECMMAGLNATCCHRIPLCGGLDRCSGIWGTAQEVEGRVELQRTSVPDSLCLPA